MPHRALQPQPAPGRPDAAASLATGLPIIAVSRARGFFLHAAALAAPETVNLAITWGRGLTCFSVTPQRAMRLGLLLGGDRRPDRSGAVFLRSVEAADCHGTGISAADRALTLRAAGASDATTTNLKSPGHVIPVMVPDGAPDSVAAAALRLLTELTPHDVPAWTDILNDEGDLATPAQCDALAERLGLALASLRG